MAAGKYGDGRDDATNGRIDQHSVDTTRSSSCNAIHDRRDPQPHACSIIVVVAFWMDPRQRAQLYGSASRHAAIRVATRLRQRSSKPAWPMATIMTDLLATEASARRKTTVASSTCDASRMGDGKRLNNEST